MKEKLRIGILSDSLHIPLWTYRIIEKINVGQYAEVVLLVINDSIVNKPTIFRRIYSSPRFTFWELYKIFANKKDKNFPNAFEPKKYTYTDIIRVKPIQKTGFDSIKREDIDKIIKYKIDVLIKFGFGTLKGNILKSAKYGVWNYYHRDQKIRIGGPAGVWEILEGSVKTGLSLEILSEDEKENLVLASSYTRTHFNSISGNNNKNYLRSVSILPRKLEELYLKGGKPFLEETKKLNQNPEYYSNRIYKKPTNSELAYKVIVRMLKRIVLRIEKLFYFKQWILLYQFTENKGRITKFYNFTRISPPKDREWADPFLIKRNNKYYIFIEEVLRKKKKGHISVMEIDKSGNFTDPVTIIEKDYHLSYPFIFEDHDMLYMIPESSKNKRIELYKCLEFPYVWELEHILMDNVVAVDTTIYKDNGKFWLFTNIKENEEASKNDELFLFYSDKLITGNWKSHPQNPIISDVRKARSAGNFFKYNDRLYRPSQDCSKHYGYALKISQIIELDENKYEDIIVDSIYPEWSKNLISTHTLNSAEDFTIIDARLKRPRFKLR